MATNITLSWFGPPEQKHVCKVPPMQTLADAAAAVSAKFKPPLAPGTFELHLAKKAVDLGTPFRLLNVPAGSKLEVIRKAGGGSAVQPAAAAPAPQQAAPPQQAEQPPQQPSAMPLSAPPAAAPAAASGLREAAPPAAAAPPAHTPPPPRPSAPAAGDPAPSRSAAAAAAAAPEAPRASPASADEAASSSSPSPLAALGVSGPVHVFHQRVLEAAAAQAPSAMDVDPPDEFFEMTMDDLARLQQQAAAKKKQEAAFRTAAVRQADAAARASALGPVRMRLHLPDGTLLQATFRATDPLSKVQDLLRKVAAPQVAPGLYLYTTPPKTVLKDAAATLYQLQLVPAAHLYVGCDDKKLGKAGTSSSSTGSSSSAAAGPFLRPEVIALMQDSLPEPAATAAAASDEVAGAGGSADAAAEAQRALRLAAAASRQAGSSTAAGGAGGDAGKVPKWMKLGGKK